MEFVEEIKRLTNKFNNTQEYIIVEGSTNILITSLSDDLNGDSFYIDSITRFIAASTLSHYYVKVKDYNLTLTKEEQEKQIINYAQDNNIKLIIDLYGTSEEHDISISCGDKDKTLLNELQDAFHEQYITKIDIKENKVEESKIETIKIGINNNCYDIESVEKLENICKALINFIKMYSNIVD